MLARFWNDGEGGFIYVVVVLFRASSGSGLTPGTTTFQPVAFGGHALLEISFAGDRPFQSHPLSGIKGKRILVVCPVGFLTAAGRILFEISLIESRFDPLALLSATIAPHRHDSY